MAFIYMTDSERFCDTIFDAMNPNAVLKEYGITVSNKESNLRENTYVHQLTTVIPSCHYASIGDQRSLELLKERTGFNFSEGDYDKRTPLHVASAYDRLNIVQYLIDQGVNVNPIDRWGATPLNDGAVWPKVKSLLASKGAILGKK